MRQPTEDHLAGALLGGGIGDALGWPFEGLGRAEIIAAGDPTGAYRPARRPGVVEPYRPGSYSDDTQQSIVVAESIVATGRIDPLDLAGRFHALWKAGRAVGIGRAFRETMERIEAGVPVEVAASAEWPWNGAAMRVGPVALLDCRRPERLAADVVAASQVTHRQPSAVAAALAVAGAVVHALTHERVDGPALVAAAAGLAEPVDAELARQVARLPSLLAMSEEGARAEILALPGARRPGGTPDGVSVVATPTVLASLYALLRSPDDYLEVVRTALRMGGDVDTFAAIAGTVAGAHLGAAALPPHLVADLQDSARLRALARELFRLAA
jgi:ADP-ribosylglycohydrolase